MEAEKPPGEIMKMQKFEQILRGLTIERDNATRLPCLLCGKFPYSRDELETHYQSGHS